jgi:trk system potassium uptake protein TrkH
MAVSRIFLWLGFALLTYAGLMLLTAIGSVILKEYASAQIFSVLAIVVALVGGVAVLTTKDTPTLENTREAIIFIVLFWLIIPFFACLPYLSLGVSSDLNHAYFEAVSAVTTTGASTLIPEEVPRAILLWRALLQWSGGVIVATFAVVILAALNLSGIGVHRSIFFTLKKGELFTKLLDIGRLITFLYGVVALVCAVLLVLFGTPIFDAVCLSLTAVSTGGLTPRSGELAGYVSGLGAFVLAFTCLLGAANVSLLWDVLRRRNISALRELVLNVEHRGSFVIVVVFFVVSFLYLGHMHVHTAAVEAAYMASTAGFDYQVMGVDIMPSSIMIALVLIGGSALSTAGGIKIIRMLLLLRHLRTDFDRMSHPSRVVPVKFQGQIVDDDTFLSVWMYFFGYTLVFALGIMALGATGTDFQYAVTASAAALSNTGPLLMAAHPEYTYSDMHSVSLSVLTVVMLFGRLEVLAMFAVMTPNLWKN